ncbi:MAG: hypothetical protein M1118_09610 [Chloroflexi bacterium]|nr:hypothetical protein [Chloroflexota bacterium]
MENDDYRIRRCLPDDVLALVALQQQWAAEDNIIGIVAATAEDVRQWLDQCCWVAEAEGRIIGPACGTVQTSDGWLSYRPANGIYAWTNCSSCPTGAIAASAGSSSIVCSRMPPSRGSPAGES